MTANAKPLLFDRQKQLLGLLHALGGVVGNRDFQKLLFLYCQTESAPPYEFVPFKYGAFSFSSYADRRRLVQRGLLENDERAWRLSPAGRQTAGRIRLASQRLAEFALRHRELRGDALVAETYRKHPFYATRSEIAAKVLKGDRAALQLIEEARPSGGAAYLATIGYEDRSLEGYLNALLRGAITLLCDVRRNAISRKYGFSKSTLGGACEGVGIRYEHLPELGIASEQRQSLTQESDYQTLFTHYVRHSLPSQLPALTRIRDWLARGERVALTCYERSPHLCHRHCVADALKAQTGGKFAPTHL